MSCDCTHKTGMPESIRRGYAAACRMLKAGDTLIDGGCADGTKALTVRDHLRGAHHIDISVIGIDNRSTDEMHDWLRSPEYDGPEDYDAETDAAVRSRAALDRFVLSDIHEADIPNGSADVVTCFYLGCGKDTERITHAKLAGFLKDGGTAVFSVSRPSSVADTLLGLKLLGWLTHSLKDRYRRVRRALRTTEIRVMTKAEALKHAQACGAPAGARKRFVCFRCTHGIMVDYS